MSKTLKERFNEDVLTLLDSGATPQILVVAVKLNTGAIETITNTSNIRNKLDYYDISYDESFQLKTNPLIRIVGYMLV